ncbi:MAG: VWA domain-containing protein [Hoeflea sp.]|uniref:vWA domain-containing protein n=1 Tax=Hoeflea sp. TaxID=1940281 RepID=UPI001D464EDE|nr:VWA domain-containing protein [Hoeflea sp.]MBU4531056.1 VWA domain-containing protein [Alphaproteobacteria bacterium]MBU4542831.1 VWA domain-containing protein [Alphaproteobacteria bacterium]MBU4552643.1 VWA domain-containing protein [Alphaproteobacteria bacterium]MBV1722948.1 VWA domain-containing protein [Hoeflea sp.]MBV1762859.1 VWA domain-containing protein [Hoeflea sp.]
MIDKDLKRLARNAPPPLEDAKRQALDAALQAFDKAGPEKKRPAQGSAPVGRLSRIVTSIRSGLMNQRYMAGTALATLMILPAAAYMTWQIARDQPGFEPELLAPLETGRSAGPDMAMETPLPPAPQQEEMERADAAPPPMAAAPRPAQRALNPVGALQQGMQRNSITLQPGSEYGQANAQRHQDGMVRSPDYPVPQIEVGRDRVEAVASHGVKSVLEEPVSTFSADVDTSSYAMVRRALKQGVVPAPETVRVEELINYFPYDYPGPDTASMPFRATVTVTPTPWNANTKLLHIGVKGYEITPSERPAANLVFLLDVSGSMNEADKLPLLKSAFRLLVNTLDPDDTVSIVTYAGEAGTVLEPTPVSDKRTILDAMDTLRPGGSTAGAAGLSEAYRLAEKGFKEGGVNRVMLATDGDFNVGQSDDQSLTALIEDKRESGVFLSVFGFGQGNYNDQLMQAIAQNGNGIAAYIDTLAEAEKTLVQEASASLFPIASDVKFQIEFNPAVVAEYRQIGFETRALNREDFNNDLVDAGEIGSGHTVTAIYEITPVGSPAILTSDLRYGEERPATTELGDELAFLKIRAKTPGEAESQLTEIPVMPEAEAESFASAADDVRFSIAVAAFGQKLRNTGQVAAFGYDEIERIARESRGDDPFGYRSEFLQLVRLAEGLDR